MDTEEPQSGFVTLLSICSRRGGGPNHTFFFCCAKETIADFSGAGFYGLYPDQPRQDHHSKLFNFQSLRKFRYPVTIWPK